MCKYMCKFLYFALMAVCIIVGGVLFFSSCTTYFPNNCNSFSFNCLITSYDVFDNCLDNDSNNCFELVFQCKKGDYGCGVSLGYYSNYNSAINYFKQNYYINESINVYTGNSPTCSLSKNISNSVVATIGLSLIGVAIAQCLIWLIYIGIKYINQRCINRSYLSINESNQLNQPINPQIPPNYSNITASRSIISQTPPNYTDTIRSERTETYLDSPPKYSDII